MGTPAFVYQTFVFKTKYKNKLGQEFKPFAPYQFVGSNLFHAHSVFLPLLHHMVLYHMNVQNQDVFKNLIWLVVDHFHPSKLELELGPAKFYAPLLIDNVWYRLWDLDLLTSIVPPSQCRV